MRNLLAIFLVLGFFVALSPATARADTTLQFFDSSETVQVSPFGAGPFNCLAETCTENIAFGGYTNPSAINMTFNIYDQDGVTLSDTLAITGAAGSNEIDSTFVSDTEGVLLVPLPGGSTIIENGSMQTAATIPLTGGSNFVVSFQSDIDPSTVPEPSSLLLLSTGLLGLGGIAKRKLLV